MLASPMDHCVAVEKIANLLGLSCYQVLWIIVWQELPVSVLLCQSDRKSRKRIEAGMIIQANCMGLVPLTGHCAAVLDGE